MQITKKMTNLVVMVLMAVSTTQCKSNLGTGGDYSAVAATKQDVAQGSYECVDKAIALLGIDMNMQSDPQLMTSILRDDMYLYDLASVKNLLAESLTKPISMNSMLEQTRSAIATKQPAVSEFLCAAVEANLITQIQDVASKNIILKMIHHSWILNALTLEMAKNYNFLNEVQTYLLNKRAQLGIRADLIGSLEDLKKIYGGKMFAPTKIVSIDWLNGSLAKTRAKGFITPEEISANQDSIKWNIMEASVTENGAGFHDNAMAGVAIANIPPKTLMVTQDDTRAVQYDISSKWASVYETWNLAFITTNVTYLNIYYPKLLIPAVIDTDSLSYLPNRIMSLWLSLNFRQFVMFNKQPDITVANRPEMGQLWGKINFKYAQDLLKEEKGEDLTSHSADLNVTLGQIVDNIKKYLTLSMTPEDAKKLSDLYND